MIERTGRPVWWAASWPTYRLGSPDPGAPLALAIHGITSTSRSWLRSARALGDRGALVAVDLRGRGASHELPPPFGIAAHVRDMVAVLDRYGLTAPVVVGHSLGAYIAASAGDRPPRAGGAAGPRRRRADDPRQRRASTREEFMRGVPRARRWPA